MIYPQCQRFYLNQQHIMYWNSGIATKSPFSPIEPTTYNVLKLAEDVIDCINEMFEPTTYNVLKPGISKALGNLDKFWTNNI